jgi:hypothetical protein
MTQTAEHTPAPWSVEPLQWDHGASIAIVAKGQIICTIAPENEEDDPDMDTAKRGPHDEANAGLIAAAPKLLAACEHAAMSIHHPACKAPKGHPNKCTCHVGKAHDAIAKAKGGAS